MSIAADLEDFFADGNEVIVSDPLRFKSKLGIGDKAYALVRARENLSTFNEAVGAGTAASAAAGSSLVASTFLAHTGFMASVLARVGLASVAATPIGWVIGVGVVTGVAYMGVARVFERSKETGVVVIPKYINPVIILDVPTHLGDNIPTLRGNSHEYPE